MGRRHTKRQIKERQENEAKWAKMERNRPRNMIICLVILIIMILVVVYRKAVGV
ncbi:MAG: hypothetical protein PHX14_02625 [Syntrophomonadaceae bacterium]|nr:hypothetical protein [Syntrophomonadaceae bacterium]